MSAFNIEIHKVVPAHDFSQVATVYCLSKGEVPNPEDYLNLQSELKRVDGVGMARRQEDVVGFVTYRRLWQACY